MLYFVVGLRCISELPGGSVTCSTESVWLGCQWPRVVMLVKVEMKTEETKTDVAVTRQHCQKLLHHVLRTRHTMHNCCTMFYAHDTQCTSLSHKLSSQLILTHTAAHFATQSSPSPTYSISVSLHDQSTHHRSDSVDTSASQNTLVITTRDLTITQSSVTKT